MDGRILNFFFTFLIVNLLYTQIHCQDECWKAKKLHNNYYKISSVEGNIVNNVFEFNNVQYVFENENKMMEDIITNEGRIFQKDEHLYFTPSKTTHEYSLFAKSFKNKFFLLLSDEHIVYILPEYRYPWKKDSIYSFDTRNFTLHKNKIIPFNTKLLLCEIESITTDATKKNLALFGRKENKPIVTILEKIPTEACDIPIQSGFGEKLYDLQQFVSNALTPQRRNCNVKNRRGKLNTCTSPHMANFTLKVQAVADAYQNGIEETKSIFKSDCSSNTNLSPSDESKLTTEIYKINDQYKLIADKLASFSAQINSIKQAFKKLSIDSFNEIVANNMEMNFDNKVYQCFTKSDLDKLNGAYSNFLSDYNDVFDNMIACESELEQFIKENKPSEIIIQ